jgi:integrase
MSTALTRTTPAEVAAAPTSVEAWIDASLADPEAARQLRANADTHAKTKKRRHAKRTIENYDYWWDRFDRWCTDPSVRIRGRALPAASPAMAFDPTDPRGLQVMLIFLYELVHGPEDGTAREIWMEDFGPVAPTTLAGAMSALKARCTDHLGHGLVLTAEVQDALRGLRRIARDAYGKDRRATPILADHLRTMLRYLAGAGDPLIARDQLLLELTAADVSPAEIARLRVDGLLEPAPGLVATTPEANADLWAATGTVGARALLVPGRQLGGGRQAAARIITLLPASPLTSAIDAWLPHRLDDDDEALIDGVGKSNPRSIHRTAIRALAAEAEAEGCTWTLTKETPAPGPADLDACRRALARRAAGDLATRQRDTAALWIGWRIALRRSELVALTVGDLKLHDSRVRVTIQESKTDQDKKGVTLPIVASQRTDGLNPITDLRAWLQTLARIHGVDTVEELPPGTPLFPALDRGQQILTRSVRLGNGIREVRRYDRMSSQAWSDRLRLIAERSGAVTDPAALANVTGHSLRRGYITAAAIAGRTAVQIRRISRHVDMNSLARYVEQVQVEWGDDPADFDMLVPDTGQPTAPAPRTTLDNRIAGGRR